MKEIIIWSILSGTLFISFLALLFIGVFRKNRVIIFSSLVTLVITLGSAFCTTCLLINKSYHKVTETLRPRTGKEIYSALFGESESECIKVLNFQDQIIPKIDYAIWLEFETCPKELKRILNQHEFIASKLAKTEVKQNGPSENDKWFKPQILGDSLLVFVYKKDDFGNGQTIYSSLDSTRVFCIDVLD